MYMHLLRHVVRRSAIAQLCRYSTTSYGTKTSTPLRILFCGSDDFSIGSLRALHEEQKRDPGLIQSIDVLCRPGKLVGRAMKTIRDVPIKAVAKELGLRVHERETFTGWDLPPAPDGPINLIIAVSFGLFVPPRILKSVEYGGLNVHPSLLPNYRGPAPLHHTILEGESHTGITLQTLDEKSFDHGTILAQTPQDGLLEIPDPFNCTHQNLLDLVTPKAAEMLVQGIRDKVFVPPLQDVGWYHPERLLHAPKITSEHRKINWKHWKPSKIHRHHRALGRLWCNIYIDHTTTKRMIFEDIEMVVKSNVFEGWLAREKSKWSRHWRKMQQIAAGRKEVKIGNTDMEVLEQSGNDIDVRFLVYATAEGERTPLMYFVDGDAIIISNLSEDKSCIRVRKITLEGERKKVARTVVEPIKDHQLWILEMSPSYRFTLIPRETSIPIRKLTSRPRATRRTNTTGKTLALVENRVIGVPLKVIRSDSDVSGVQRDANPGLRRPSPSCWLEKDQRASKPLENSASNMGGPRRSPSSRPPSSAPIASPSTAPKATTGGPIIRKVRPNQQTKWLYINFRPRTT